MKYADVLIAHKLVSVPLGMWADVNSEGGGATERCVWGGVSYIMQIHSRKVIRATEQIPALWINLLIGSRRYQILMGSDIGWEWERFSPHILEQEHVCVTVIMSAGAWCQSLSLRDEVTLNHTHTIALKHTHFHILSISQRGKQPSSKTEPRNSILTHLTSVGLYHH